MYKLCNEINSDGDHKMVWHDVLSERSVKLFIFVFRKRLTFEWTDLTFSTTNLLLCMHHVQSNYIVNRKNAGQCQVDYHWPCNNGCLQQKAVQARKKSLNINHLLRLTHTGSRTLSLLLSFLSIVWVNRLSRIMVLILFTERECPRYVYIAASYKRQS